jgi:hypothetical protein
MRFARGQRHSLTTMLRTAGGAEAGGNSTTCYLPPPHVASKGRAARGEAKEAKNAMAERVLNPFRPSGSLPVVIRESLAEGRQARRWHQKRRVVPRK